MGTNNSRFLAVSWTGLVIILKELLCFINNSGWLLRGLANVNSVVNSCANNDKYWFHMVWPMCVHLSRINGQIASNAPWVHVRELRINVHLCVIQPHTFFKWEVKI